MKFLVDAQLPRSLSEFLKWKHHDSVHSSELPLKNLTSDRSLIVLSKKENRIVITKDSDFLDSYLLKSEPQKLILIKTGNISNKELINIFDRNLGVISELLLECNLIEISQYNIVGHK